MVIFHSYVKLPEGNPNMRVWIGAFSPCFLLFNWWGTDHKVIGKISFFFPDLKDGTIRSKLMFTLWWTNIAMDNGHL